MNGDGIKDILWKHSSGYISRWEMGLNGVTRKTGIASIQSHWDFVSLADSDGDGVPDYLSQTKILTVGLFRARYYRAPCRMVNRSQFFTRS